MLLYHFHQESRSSGAEPIIAKCPCRKKVQYGKRIVNKIDSIPRITVVPLFYFPYNVIENAFIVQCNLFNVFGEIVFEFILCVTCYCSIILIKSDVPQIIQIGKNRNLAELGYACHKKEFDVIVRILDDRIETFQNLSVFIGLGNVVNVINNGFVVFVYQ